MATTAAIRLRHARPVAALDLRDSDNSTVIGDALSVVLTAASISWKHRKQHGFCALAGGRSDCGAGQTTLSCRIPRPVTKSGKQGGNAMPSSRTISANGIE